MYWHHDITPWQLVVVHRKQPEWSRKIMNNKKRSSPPALLTVSVFQRRGKDEIMGNNVTPDVKCHIPIRPMTKALGVISHVRVTRRL